MKKLFILLFICLITSCSTYKKNSYFQDLETNLQGELTSINTKYSMTIQPDDELSIIVSSVDPQAAAAFNLPLISTPVARPYSETKITYQTSINQSIQTYLVDARGEINFPVLGRIQLSGMSRDEAMTYLEDRLKEYIKDPIVNMQTMNFKVSVLGEVNQPGSFYYTNQNVSVLDALASAKDLTIHGQRNNVLLIRDIDGKKEYAKFDLTKTEMFASPYFYLKQNDVLYVLPNKEKQRDANSGQQKQFNLTVITASIGYIISVLAILVR